MRAGGGAVVAPAWMEVGKARGLEGGVWWKSSPAMGAACQERAVQSLLPSALLHLFVLEQTRLR